jgi:hypothetical protein
MRFYLDARKKPEHPFPKKHPVLHHLTQFRLDQQLLRTPNAQAQ